MGIAGMILGIMGVAGMILGIIGLAFSTIPIFGAFISGPCVCVGLPLSGIAFFKSRKSKTSIGIPIAGLATNIVAIIVINAWIFLSYASVLFGWDQTHR